MSLIAVEIETWAGALQQASSTSPHVPIGPNDTPEQAFQKLQQTINNMQAAQNRSLESFQQIEQDTERIAVPSCMIHAKAELIRSMNDTMQGTAVSGDSLLMSLYFQKAADEQESALDELTAVMECAPFCVYDEQNGLSNR